MTMVMSPLRLSFGMMRPLYKMQLGSPCQLAKVEFRVCNTRNLVLGIIRRNQSKMSLIDNYTLEFALSKINSKI
jgi:hypothetical protein